MLERATACLKAGARDSLKCAQQAPRSKRMLHQAFWNHGAGDLDLPPWAVSMMPMPSDLPLQRDSTPKRRSAKEATCMASAQTDGAFLDFLYPPQALAWLHRVNGQHLERWERRNSRRLPEGFVQTTRGYSSRSHGHSATSQPEYEERDHSDEHLKSDKYNVGASGSEARSQVPRALEEQTQDNHDKLVTGNQDLAQQSMPGSSSVGDNVADGSSEMSFADFPGDLAETNAEEPRQDPLHALRGLLAGSRLPKGEDKATRAWTLYNLLGEDDRKDARLKKEMIFWLCKQENTIADAHSISLYWSLPLGERSLPTYQAALSAFLRRNDQESALGLHKEALDNIPNGHQITRELFKQALEQERWEIALDAKDQHHEAFSAPNQTHQRAIFWLNVTEIPDLPKIAARFISKLKWWRRRKKQNLARYLSFCSQLNEEALKQVLAVPCDSKRGICTMRLADAGLLFDCVREWSTQAPRILEQSLFSLLRQNQSKQQYKGVHRIVSYAYFHYRTTANFKPSEALLMVLLQRLVRFARDFRTIPRSSHNVTISMLITDWERHHGKLSSPAVLELITFHASLGKASEVQKWLDYLKKEYPNYHDQKDALASAIYVHARRADLSMALKTFHDAERLAKANNEQLDLKCWNALLHAHSRADNLDGALVTFRSMVEEAKLVPNERSIHPISEMLASRGDVQGVEDLLEQFDILSEKKRVTHFVGSQLNALVNTGEMQKAEAVLQQTVQQVRAGEVLGSLTTCFNILITAYALRRDVNATMRIYRSMKAAKIWMDALTYSALMQALIHYRQTHAAEKIMTTVMQREGFKPQALHYAILIAGYTNERQYQRALLIHEKMDRNHIKPTLAIQKAYLKAKALQEQAKQGPVTAEGKPAPLEAVIAELQKALGIVDGSEIAPKQPAFGYEISERGTVVSEYVASVMFVHGSRRCLEAVKEMFAQYRSEMLEAGHSPDPPPIRILTALMNALLRAREYAQLEGYWKVAKDQADIIASLTAVPEFAPAEGPREVPPEPQTLPEPLDLSPSVNDNDRAEIGFAANDDTTVIQVSQTLLPRSSVSLGPRPAPARTHILTRPLRHYLHALAAQGRIGDAVTTCTRLLTQGYTFDIITWNRFIEHLCTSSPPLVLLAFTLTERFLIRNFPGWTSSNKFFPQVAARDQGLQHIRARYLRPDQIMPQYRTMVHLAAAFLKLRRMEATRGQQRKRDQGGLRRLVGTAKQIGERAPSTLAAVQTMPHVEDKLQHTLLRS